MRMRSSVLVQAMAASTVLVTVLTAQTTTPERQLVMRAADALGGRDPVMALKTLQIVGYGELFELYSRNFLMSQFWALTILLFAFAMIVAELIGALERRVEYYAGVRS